MKKFLAIVLAAATIGMGAAGMVGCKDRDENTIVVGVTDYEPMDYRNEAGEWIGFDAELAKKVLTDLGYTVKFQEIEWETKIVTLKAGTIDVIWNGMTITDELKENILLSDVYLENRQYGVVKASEAESYTSAADLAGKKVAYESGSAAEGLVKDIECTKNGIATQNAAVMEVASNKSDVAVVDYLLAVTLTSEGSDYYGDLVAVDLGFAVEEFAIGFRKEDTQLCADVNAKIKQLTKDGFVKTLAEKYGIENQLRA